MQKSTIIFDFDGTLADTIPLIYQVSSELAQEFGFDSLTKEQFEKLREKSPFEIINELHIPILKIPFILHRGRERLKKYMKDAAYIDGMRTVMYSLKQHEYKIGILTSNSRENIDIFLEKHQLKIFDFIYTENNLFGKQFSLRNIIKKENLTIKSTIYVGDEVRDIDACRALDLDVIAVTWGFSSKLSIKKYEPTYIADKPEQIIEILHPLP